MRRLAWGIVLVLTLLPSIAFGAANDPYFELQWGLVRIGGPAGWTVTKGLGQVVAVVDTGVDVTHPDLQGQLAAAVQQLQVVFLVEAAGRHNDPIGAVASGHR